MDNNEIEKYTSGNFDMAPYKKMYEETKKKLEMPPESVNEKLTRLALQLGIIHDR